MRILLTLLGWTVSLALGFAFQRRLRDPGNLSHLLFIVTFWITEPLLVFFAYTTVRLDLQLLAIGAVVVTGSWAVLAMGVGLGAATSRDRRERGAIALTAALGNTASVGYPLATLVFGPGGLALAVLYSQFQFLIPGIAVLWAVARRFAGPASRAPAATGTLALARGWLVNPPVAAGVLALALHFGGVDLRQGIAPVGPPAGIAIGLFGFFQLGLAMPLEPIVHTLAEVGRAAGVLTIKCIAGPLVLVVLANLTGVHLPGVCVLLAATPVAFNTVVVSRVYDLDTALVRLVVVVSTPLVIAVVLVGHAIL